MRRANAAQKRVGPLLEEGIVPVVTGFIGAIRRRRFDHAWPRRLGLLRHDSRRGDRRGRNHHLDRRGGRADRRPALVSRCADDSGDFLPRSSGVGLLWREGASSQNSAAGDAGRHPGIDSQQLRARKSRTQKLRPKGRSIGGGVKALTAIRDVALISVGGPGIVGVTDVVGRTFSTTAALRAEVLLISQSSSQNDICFIVAKARCAAHAGSAPEGVCARPAPMR